MIHLDLEDLLHVARRTLGAFEVRDIGLLESAAARPQATAFGEDAYPSIHDKAAALLHSVARNHPLFDGNERLSLAATDHRFPRPPRQHDPTELTDARRRRQ